MIYLDLSFRLTVLATAKFTSLRDKILCSFMRFCVCGDRIIRWWFPKFALSCFRLRAFGVSFACFRCFVCVRSVVHFRFLCPYLNNMYKYAFLYFMVFPGSAICMYTKPIIDFSTYMYTDSGSLLLSKIYLIFKCTSYFG